MTLFWGTLFSISYLATVVTRTTLLGLPLAAFVSFAYFVLQRWLQILPDSFHPVLPNWILNPFDNLFIRRCVLHV